MAQQETTRSDESADQCRAVTEDGERCSRSAADDGFCHQHGPDDETVDDRGDGGDQTDGGGRDESGNQDESGTGTEGEEGTGSEDGDEASDDQTEREERTGRDGREPDGGVEASDESTQGADPTPDPDDPELGLSDDDDGDLDVLAVRDAVEEVAEDLIGHPLDGIIEIAGTDDGWQVVVEVVERSAVPDTQDLLGQYSVTLDDSGNVTGYRLAERYRRGDEKQR
jgi:hypothetical protein